VCTTHPCINNNTKEPLYLLHEPHTDRHSIRIVHNHIITSHHITSHHITSHYTTPHHTTPHHTTPHHTQTQNTKQNNTPHYTQHLNTTHRTTPYHTPHQSPRRIVRASCSWFASSPSSDPVATEDASTQRCAVPSFTPDFRLGSFGLFDPFKLFIQTIHCRHGNT